MDDWNEELERTEPDPLTDLGALWTARDPEELWRALVVYPGRSTTHHWEAVQLFRRHHEGGTPGAPRTALLLCTDRRWDRCTARLIAGIADTSILGEDDLDELADCFLWSDAVRFQYPVSWIGTEWVGIDLDGADEAADGSVVHLDSDTPVPSERSIAPPLRRWAAARVLRTDPGTFDAMQVRARKLEVRGGSAVVSGILDAIEALDEGSAREAIELGLSWARGSVRLLALDLLAAHYPETARDRAATDPDKKVRGWTPRRPRGSLASVPEANGRPAGGQGARSSGATRRQATLLHD